MVECHLGTSTSEPLFLSRVSVTAGAARTKHVTLPLVDVPVPMGMHGEVASHYGVQEGDYEPQPTTLDYLVGAAVACLCGLSAACCRGSVSQSAMASWWQTVRVR